MKMLRITLSIGFNDKVSGKQEISTAEAIKTCASILCDYVDGATIYSTTGIFRHENGMQVTEEGIRIECFEPDKNMLRKACAIIKEKLNQEAIYWTEEQIFSEMV